MVRKRPRCSDRFPAQRRAEILEFDRMIMAWHRSSETSKRLDAIPGVVHATKADAEVDEEHFDGKTTE